MYDPKGIMYSQKKKINSAEYVHQSRPHLEWRANIETCPVLSQMEESSSEIGGKGDTTPTDDTKRKQA